MTHFDLSRRGALLQFLLTCATCAWIGAIAWIAKEPLLFPAFGATTFIVFWVPHLPPAAPRNAICAHLAAAAIGWLALRALGPSNPWLADAPEWLAKVGAPSLALGVTCFVMHATRWIHPPAGATTLIFAMGMLTRPLDIAMIGLGIAGACASAWVAHRATGRPYPLWAPNPAPVMPSHAGEERLRRSA